MRREWPSAFRLPSRVQRYEVDGLHVLDPRELRTLLDVLEVDLEPYFVEYHDYLLTIRSGVHACMVTLSTPDQPTGDDGGQLHISISRGVLDGRRAPPAEDVEQHFLALLADPWPGETARVPPTEGQSYRAHHFIRDVGPTYVQRLLQGVAFWEGRSDMRYPARAWAAVDPVAAALSQPSMVRELARWAAEASEDMDARGAVTALAAAAPSPVIALEPGLLDALLRTDPPGPQRPPFDAFAIDMLREIDGARILVAVKVPHFEVLTIFALPARWPQEAEVQCTELHSHLVQNVCAYMAHVDRGEERSNVGDRAALQASAERKKGSKRKRLMRRLASTPSITTVRLGGGYQPAGPSGAGGDEAARREHWVRGHWRSVPCGPRTVPLDERPRRSVWIAAHRRCEGSSAGRVEARTYLASAPQEQSR